MYTCVYIHMYIYIYNYINTSKHNTYIRTLFSVVKHTNSI